MCTLGKDWLKTVLLSGLIVMVAVPWQDLAAQPQPGLTQNDSANARNEAVTRITASNTQLKLVERSARILELDQRIKLVDGFDPEVLEVTAINADNKIRVRAIKAGVTTMTIVDEKNVSYTIEIFVVGDVRHLQVTINRLFPKASVTAVKVADSVVLKGWVTQPEHITNIIEIAEQFFGTVLNHMRVGGGQQVMLKVKVMEVQRSKIRKMGINFFYLNDNSYFTNTVGKLTTVSDVQLPFGGPPTVTATADLLADSNFLGGITNDSNIFQAYVQALKEESLLKILAEPTLVATNGRPANILSGGEFPILVPQSLGVIGIEWREFGVRLEAVPILLGNGRLRLELQPEVSERDFSNAVQVQGLTVPGLTSRRVNTQVEMRFGETFVLAGLIATRDTAETSKVPVLGDMPWVGAAFRRVRYDESETELVIMVTPEPVGPIPECEVPAGGPGRFTDAPVDRELFIDGMIEIPSYGDRCNGHDCINQTGYNAVPGSHVIQGSETQMITPEAEMNTLPATPELPKSTGSDLKENPTLPVLDKSASSKTEKGTSSTWTNTIRKVSFLPKKKSNQNGNNLTALFKSKTEKETPETTTSNNVNSQTSAARGWKKAQLQKAQLIEPKPGLIQPETVDDPFLN